MRRKNFFKLLAPLGRVAAGLDDGKLEPDSGEEVVGRVVRVPGKGEADAEVVELAVMISWTKGG